MSLLTSTCNYAIRASLHVAAENPGAGTFVSTRRIAEDLDVSFPFLTKVLLGLTQHGILVSQRGAAGGVALARPAATIMLIDIVTSAGGDTIFGECVLGLPKCSDESPCALHHSWKEERLRIESLFRDTSLADLVSANRRTGPAGTGVRRRRTSPTARRRRTS